MSLLDLPNHIVLEVVNNLRILDLEAFSRALHKDFIYDYLDKKLDILRSYHTAIIDSLITAFHPSSDVYYNQRADILYMIENYMNNSEVDGEDMREIIYSRLLESIDDERENKIITVSFIMHRVHDDIYFRNNVEYPTMYLNFPLILAFVSDWERYALSNRLFDAKDLEYYCNSLDTYGIVIDMCEFEDYQSIAVKIIVDVLLTSNREYCRRVLKELGKDGLSLMFQKIKDQELKKLLAVVIMDKFKFEYSLMTSLINAIWNDIDYDDS